MDLSTSYLGLNLAHPFMPGASPLGYDLDMVGRLEDAGASAIVMPSLFQEDVAAYSRASGEYMERLLRIKRRVGIPVIASLNGTSSEGWLQYASLIERAGADALEMNFYYVATDLSEDARAVERRVVDIVAVVTESIRIPLAVKLSPFFSALPHLAGQLDRLGADGLILFNRFYQPNIDPERREAGLALRYSDSSELPLRLRWTAILSGRVRMSLALTGGVQSALDGVKAVLAGAHAVQIVSALMQGGPRRLTEIRDGFCQWADQHEYASVDQMRGLANLSTCSNPRAFERGNYVETLRGARLPAEVAGH